MKKRGVKNEEGKEEENNKKDAVNSNRDNDGNNTT